MHTRAWLLAVGSFAAAVAPAVARADCSAGPFYTLEVAGNTVTVVFGGNCGSDTNDALLRENEADGTVVDVTSSCEADTSGNFVDQCVAPGTYRYGFAEAFCGTCGGTALFQEATVTSPLPSDCTPTYGSGPTPTTTVPPWMTGGADGGITASVDCPGTSCGFCSTTSATRRSVRAFDLLAFGVGLSLVYLRARRRRRGGAHPS